MDVSDLTPELLRKLYEDELLPESEIAARFGTYQVKINRLRKKWGIPTIGKTGRIEASLPALTPIQEELLVGSLLGDGHMSRTSKSSARFIERHSDKQEGYLRWKAALMGPYVSSIYEVTKTDPETGKVYPGIEMATVSCPQLSPWHKLFYSGTGGSRQFPSNLYKLLTPFALAVWFMDDGGLMDGFHPRITFGLDPLSLKRAKRALREIGLEPKEHPDRDAVSLHFPGQADVFWDCVGPHIPDVMAYKRPSYTKRRVADRNAAKLTPGQALSLYENGLSLSDVAGLYNVGRTTVRRRIVAAGGQTRSQGRRKRSLTPEGAHALLEPYDPEEWGSLDVSGKDAWVEEILALLRECGFPNPSLDRVPVEDELRRLREVRMSLDGKKIVPWTPIGARLCNPFFPNRFKATSKSKVSAFEAWHSDRKLRKAIRFQLDHGDPVVPHRVLRAVTMQHRTPSVFKPTIAKFLYETFCPEGGHVWDPCAGYGGRLLGAFVAGVTYTGTDVEPGTVEGNLELGRLLGADCEVHCCPAESFTPPSVDFVFTSPPYFDRERYSERAAQSWKRHGSSLENWLEGFVRPVAASARGALPVGGLFGWNIADLKERGEEIPLVESSCAVIVEEGFRHEDTLLMPLAKLNRADPVEPILLFRKV